MPRVKTAISIDEALFREADVWSKKMGVSRSELFSRAVADYVRQRENEELLRRLNEAHADGPDEEDKKLLEHMSRYRAWFLEQEERREREEQR